jgi:hypothetical protein
MTALTPASIPDRNDRETGADFVADDRAEASGTPLQPVADFNPGVFGRSSIQEAICFSLVVRFSIFQPADGIIFEAVTFQGWDHKRAIWFVVSFSKALSFSPQDWSRDSVTCHPPIRRPDRQMRKAGKEAQNSCKRSFWKSRFLRAHRSKFTLGPFCFRSPEKRHSFEPEEAAKELPERHLL